MAISQFQAFRGANTYIRYNDDLNNSVVIRSLATGVLYVSEMVMLIYLCHSMNYALKLD